MAAPIHLDLRTGLPKVRAAYDAGELRLGQCRYSAPCAVGVMMTPKQRASLPQERRVNYLVHDRLDVPADQLGDFARLQWAFDGGCAAGFASTLASLETKYLKQEA